MDFKKVYNDLLNYVKERYETSIPLREETMANTENTTTIEPMPRRKISVEDINIEVPEAMIQQAAMAIGGNNNFAQMLMVASRYRAANLTPVYLTDESQSALRVIAREYVERPNMLN